MRKQPSAAGPGPRFGMFHLLMHTGHLLEERCRAELAELGLHHGQARVLMTLNRHQGISQAKLAGGMDIATPTLSIMLKKLVAQGLVERTADEKDERVQRLALTAEGHRAVKKVVTVWDSANQDILHAVAGEDAQLLHDNLLKIRNMLGGKSPGL